MNLFNLVGKIGLDSSDYEKGIKKASRETEEFARDLSGDVADAGTKTKKTYSEMQADVMKLATEYKKSGATQSEAMKKAHATIDKSMYMTKKESDELEDRMTNNNKKIGFSFRDLPDDINKVKGSLSKVGGALSVVGKGIQVAAGAAAAFTGAAIAVAESTREYREDVNKLDVAFQSQNKSIDEGRRAFSEFYGLLGETDRSIEAVNHLAELTNNQEELTKWTTIAAGVTAKFGDSLPIEGLTESANETAKVGKITGNLADALTWAGVCEDEFNAKLSSLTSEQERATFITDELNGLYLESGEAYLEMNDTIIKARESQLLLEDAMARIGAQVEPFVTNLKTMFGEGIHSLIDAYETDGLTGLVNASFNMLNSSLQTFAANMPQYIEVGLEMVQTLFKSLMDNLPTIVQSAEQILKTIVDTLVTNIPKLIPVALQMIVDLGNYIVKNLPHIFQTGIDILMSIVDGIINALPTFIATVPKLINDFCDAIYGLLWKLPKVAFDLIVKLGSALVSNIPLIVANAGEIFRAILNVFSLSSMYSLGKGLMSKLGTSIKGMLGTVKANAKTIFDGIKSNFTPSGLVQAGKDLISGLWAGISAMKSWITSKVSGFFSGIVGTVKNVFQIKSPSRVFKSIGKDVGRGFDGGLENEMQNVNDKMPDVFGETIETAKRTIDNADIPMTIDMTRMVNGSINATPNNLANEGVQITIETVYNNSEQDIETLAEELAYLIQKKKRRLV